MVRHDEGIDHAQQNRLALLALDQGHETHLPVVVDPRHLGQQLRWHALDHLGKAQEAVVCADVGHEIGQQLDVLAGSQRPQQRDTTVTQGDLLLGLARIGRDGQVALA
ncbi:MAG: hypothetical protein ACK559_42250, partial [bacterium]